MVLACCLMGASRFCAQAPPDNNSPAAGQSNAGSGARTTPAGQSKPTPPAVPQSSANPFPEDTSKVPVLPSTLAPDVPQGTFSDTDSAAASLPEDDLDPVRSPDEPGAANSAASEQESSSDIRSMDSLLPGPGDDESGKRRNKKSDALDGAPAETSKEDISVGKYYMDQKNWRAALSRFQSALVLAPEDPDVYWGLAESARHLGNFADAKSNYLKVIEYDPDSKHAKEAQKLLKDPEIENAKAAPAPQ